MAVVATQLVTVTIDSAPGEVPAGAPAEMACVLELGTYSQERGKTDYACMSSNDSYVGLGAITRTPLELTTLYNEDLAATEGQAVLKENFASNTPVEATIEFNNTLGANGTILTGIFGISKFDMDFPKDGNIGAAFSLEFLGEPTITPAA